MKEKEHIKPKEYALCNLGSVTAITQFLDLMRMSDARIGLNQLRIQQHNPVDVKPKSTNLIEPGEGFEPRE